MNAWSHESTAHGWLFALPTVVALCILWVLIWFVLDRALQRIMLLTNEEAPLDQVSGGVATSLPAKGFYQQKLLRMSMYCALASAGGLVLFATDVLRNGSVESILESFGPVHQVFFAMAISHWLLNIWEDWRTREFLGQGLSSEAGGGMALFPLNILCTPNQIMLSIYFLHHSVSAFAYAYSLATLTLGGVMVQGLIFELPVILMLRREYAIAFPVHSRWLQDRAAVQRHWLSTYLLFLLGRGPAELLWILSLTPAYSTELAEHTGRVGLIVYHTLAVFFTSLNMRIVGLYWCWHAHDLEMAATSSKSSKDDDEAVQGGQGGPAPQTVGAE